MHVQRTVQSAHRIDYQQGKSPCFRHAQSDPRQLRSRGAHHDQTVQIHPTTGHAGRVKGPRGIDEATPDSPSPGELSGSTGPQGQGRPQGQAAPEAELHDRPSGQASPGKEPIDAVDPQR